jgi:N-acetylmuramoyl-L-alanine amidase
MPGLQSLRDRCLQVQRMGFRSTLNGVPSLTGRTTPRFALFAVGLLAVVSAQGRTTRALPARTPFEHAEQLRSVLETQPEADRTRRDYERVLDAYRTVYHGDPVSSKADASINAVAELLTEEGRVFQLQKPLHDALGEYEFLRHQYPSSRYRFAALIAEAEIYQRDLADPEQAKEKFQEFLKTYPKHPLAAQARAELKDLRKEEAAEKATGGPAPEGAELPLQNSRNQDKRNQDTRNQDTRKQDTRKQPSQADDAPAADSQVASVRREDVFPERPAISSPAPSTPPLSPPRAPGTGSSHIVAISPDEQGLPEPAALSAVKVDAAPPAQRERPARVTDIRYWSNAQYTRIAIDLEDQVRFQSGRVPNPDRVYFDLQQTRLISRLNGKSVTVTDAGFLKRIRSAQYSGEVTRIVLDVNSRAAYSAFFLPNPWRLIIDIHEHKAGSDTPETTKSMPEIASASVQTARPVPKQVITIPLQPHVNSHAGNELEALSTEVVAPAPTVGMRPKSSSGKPSPFVLPAASLQTAPMPLPAAQPPRLGMESGQTNSQTAGSQTGTQVLAKPSARTNSRHNAASSSDVPSVADDADPDGPRDAEPPVTADGERSLVRTLGLKIGRIVIDAGHGGHDCGTLGPGGIQEKDITLDVALRLGKLLKQRLGADVIYTRDDDTFVPLQMRTAIANRANADLFISIHANSSSDSEARGVESYYLNFTTAPDALEVAARENAVSDGSIHELSDLVKEITLKDKIEESRQFAADVQRSLYNGLEEGNPGLKDRGVKKAPFVVLIGANMPSILAEISFLTNPDDAHELRQPAYRQRIAESLYRGVAKYVNGLSGIRLAENRDHPGAN